MVLPAAFHVLYVISTHFVPRHDILQQPDASCESILQYYNMSITDPRSNATKRNLRDPAWRYFRQVLYAVAPFVFALRSDIIRTLTVTSFRHLPSLKYALGNPTIGGNVPR
jgi:hypothetical protein